MPHYTPRETARTIGGGMLLLPAMPCNADFGFDPARYRVDLDWLAGDAVVGLKRFILSPVAIRNRQRGYAVSMIKAGMRVIGRNSGPVRSPLTDLTEAEMAEIAALVKIIAT